MKGRKTNRNICTLTYISQYVTIPKALNMMTFSKCVDVGFFIVNKV